MQLCTSLASCFQNPNGYSPANGTFLLPCQYSPFKLTKRIEFWRLCLEMNQTAVIKKEAEVAGGGRMQQAPENR
jgi:hypothetical protein